MATSNARIYRIDGLTPYRTTDYYASMATITIRYVGIVKGLTVEKIQVHKCLSNRNLVPVYVKAIPARDTATQEAQTVVIFARQDVTKQEINKAINKLETKWVIPSRHKNISKDKYGRHGYYISMLKEAGYKLTYLNGLSFLETQDLYVTEYS